MIDKIIFEKAFSLIARSDAAYLSVIDADGYPDTRAMLNLHNPQLYPLCDAFFREHTDGRHIYFTTNTSSRKVGFLAENAHAAVYYCFPGEWNGVMIKGNVHLVGDASIKEALWQKGWEMYYPKGSSDPDYAILKLVPAQIRGYNAFTIYDSSADTK